MKYNFTLENIKKDLINNKIVTHIFVFVIGFISALLFTQFGTSEEDTKLIEARLVQKCQAQFKAESPATGQDENSLACYQEVLKTYPNNADALAGLEKIEARYVIWIKGFLERKLLDEASEYLRKLFLLDPLSPKLAELETRFKQLNLIAPLLLKCQAHFDGNRLTRGKGGNALSCYRDVLKKDPNNADALAGIEKIEARYATMIEDSLKKGLQKKVKLYLKRLQDVGLQSPNLAELEKRFLQQQVFGPDVSLEIGRLLLECQTYLDENSLTRGPRGNALACYRDVLTKDPNNAFALAGLEKIETRYATMIKQELDKGDLDNAEKYLARLRNINNKSMKLEGLQVLLASAIERYLEERLPLISWAAEEKMDGQISIDYLYLVRLRELKPNSSKIPKFEAQLLKVLEEGVNRRENRIFLGGGLDNEYLAMLRSLNPNSPKLVELETEFIELIEQMLEKGQLNEAKEYLAKLHDINPSSQKLVDLVVRFMVSVKQMIKAKSEDEQIWEAGEYLNWLERLNLNSPKLVELKLWFQQKGGKSIE